MKQKRREATTIQDLLTKDDINGILKHLDEIKPRITELLVVYLDEDKRYHWQITDETLVTTATWMLESVKLDIMQSD